MQEQLVVISRAIFPDPRNNIIDTSSTFLIPLSIQMEATMKVSALLAEYLLYYTLETASETDPFGSLLVSCPGCTKPDDPAHNPGNWLGHFCLNRASSTRGTMLQANRRTGWEVLKSVSHIILLQFLPPGSDLYSALQLYSNKLLIFILYSQKSSPQINITTLQHSFCILGSIDIILVFRPAFQRQIWHPYPGHYPFFVNPMLFSHSHSNISGTRSQVPQ